MGVSIMPRQPSFGQPSSTLRLWRRKRSGWTGWAMPVSGFTLGSLQLVWR